MRRTVHRLLQPEGSGEPTVRCPYQMPGNWRWKPKVEKDGTVSECAPPPDGEKGYRTNAVYKATDWYDCKHG